MPSEVLYWPMMRQYRLGLVGVLVVLLAVAGATTLWTPGAQEDPDRTPNGTVTTSASGSVSTAPDLAVVDVAVEASADTASAARTAVAENVTRLRDALTRANVSDDQIRTTSFSIRSERDDNGSVTYDAAHEFELRVPVDDAGRIVDAAVTGGATRVDGVRFTLTDATVRELRADALRKALANARSDAAVIADATGMAIQDVQTVQTADGGGPVFAETARGDGTQFDPGPVTVTASVTVTYSTG